MEKLKNHWKINSNIQLITILIVFAVNGSVSAYLNRFLLSTLQITKENLPTLSFWIIYIVFLSIIYFGLLAITSRVFGQKKFFKEFAIKSLKPIGLHYFVF